MPRIEHDESESHLHSLRGKVFTQLQNDILNGKYQPGDSLIETRLSEELGVSRTPIREAIRQLELEGLVQSIPNKGAIVTGISAKDIEDIYTIRMMIEGLAARWAAEKMTEEELAELKEAVELEEFYTMKNDTEHLLKFDSVFHEIIFKACKSKPLMHTLSTFHHYVQRARNASLGSPGRAQKVLEEHKAILQAITERNAEQAEKLTTEHIRNASKNLIKQNEKTEET
ncbi:MAG: GntR family transcriptional regulator [Clostridia bacterium]|nr:GntR family transcriptional regulator [Clostridia bacterium]